MEKHFTSKTIETIDGKRKCQGTPGMVPECTGYQKRCCIIMTGRNYVTPVHRRITIKGIN